MSWDPRARADDALVLVEATKKSFVLADEEEGDDDEAGGDIEEQFGRIMDEWSARADAGDLHLRLAPPWDTYYQDFYESIWWLLPFRVVLPSYALYTSVFAALQSEQYLTQRMMVSEIAVPGAAGRMLTLPGMTSFQLQPGFPPMGFAVPQGHEQNNQPENAHHRNY